MIFCVEIIVGLDNHKPVCICCGCVAMGHIIGIDASFLFLSILGVLVLRRMFDGSAVM